MIDERLMQPGRWDMTLKPETPLKMRHEIAFRDHFVVTRARLPWGVSYHDVLAESIYTGVVLERQRGGPNDAPSWGGLNLLYWMGDTDKTPAYDFASTGDRLETFTTFLGELWILNPGYTAGGIEYVLSSVPSTQITDDVTDNPLDSTIMTYIDRWRRKTNGVIEFAIRHEGKIYFSEFGAGSTFVQTPEVLISRDGYQAPTLRSAKAAKITDKSDVYDEQSSLTVRGRDLVSNGTATNSDWTDFNGLLIAGGTELAAPDVVADDIYWSGSGSSTAYNLGCQYKAANMLKRRRQLNVITVPVSAICPNLDLSVGDYFYAYDPWTELRDAANSVQAEQVIQPKEVRASALRWDVMPGMGVYWLQTQQLPDNASRDDPTYVVDITDYVEMAPEPMLEIEVDTIPPFRGWVSRSPALSA